MVEYVPLGSEVPFFGLGALRRHEISRGGQWMYFLEFELLMLQLTWATLDSPPRGMEADEITPLARACNDCNCRKHVAE